MDTFKSPRSHITDSRFYGSGYTTEEAKLVFCEILIKSGIYGKKELFRLNKME